MSLSIEQIRGVLAAIAIPDTDRSLSDYVADRDVRVQGGVVHVRIVLGHPARTTADLWRDQAASALVQAGARQAHVTVESKILARAVKPGLKPLPTVRNIIAVASAKGGVGKSTTAANLALALSAEGARVGILDADIYGPSQPTILGISGRPESRDNKTMEPFVGHGVEANSIGFLIDAESPAIWRGPMVTQALEQLLRATNWGDLDYLIVDMPPGTGDIALTLAQKVPVVGAVIVTTPQELAVMDARKGVRMFQKVDVPILGVIENMAVHVCSSCGHAEHIFGEGGGERMAQQYDLTWLGALPLDRSIREHADAGRPVVVADPQGPAALAYSALARRLAAAVERLPRDTAGLFPPVVAAS